MDAAKQLAALEALWLEATTEGDFEFAARVSEEIDAVRRIAAKVAR